MSRDQGPGVSLFQGAENLSLEINGKSPEEEEDIEDENRRKEELHDLLKSAFDDLNTDDDSSVANSSHYSGASHPHETGTECENIQPSISPCEVDYNKVIEFEPNHRPDDTGCSGDLDHSLYCRDTSRSEPHQVSSTSHQDKSHTSSCHNISNVSSSQDFHPMTATPVGRKKAKQNAKQKNQQHQQNNLNNSQHQQNNQQQNQPHQLNNQHRHQNDKHHNQQHLLNDHQQLNNHQHRHDQQHNGQQHYENSPGDGVGAITALPDSELRHYIQQMDAKFDAEKVQMEKLLLAELSDKVKLNSELKCSEEEKQRVQVLEREIQELRDNVNNLVKIKENTNKELDLSKITIYDLQQKISLLEQKKNVSKSMKSYERIIEQLKCDYEKQEKHYQSVQNKVLSEFERLKGELEKIRTEKDKMATEINRSVDFIRTKLLDDPNFDMSKLKDLEAAESADEDCGFSVIRTLQQFLRMKQCDIIKSLKTCNNRPNSGPGGDSKEPCDTPPESDKTPAPTTLPADPNASSPDHRTPTNTPPQSTSPTRGEPQPTPEEKESKALEKSKADSPKSDTAVVKGTPLPVARSPKSSETAKNNNLAELNSILLDRLKKRESQLRSMILECLNLSEVHFDSMKDVMNDFVRFHFAESLRIVSKPPKNASSKTIETMIDQERRKDDLLKEFLDNFRNFIEEKKKEKLTQIREIQLECYASARNSAEPATGVSGPTTGQSSTDPEEDEQLLFDLKKMKNSFVNEINYVREQLLNLGKENEKLQNKCDAYEKKNKSVMDELKTLKAQMGTQQNGDASNSINKKKGKSKTNTSSCKSSSQQNSNGTQTIDEENEENMNLSLPDSSKPEDLAKLEKSLDMKLMYEKNELLKALNRAHNEIKTKESLLQRMECDYYDKILEIEQHSVDLYAEEVQKIESTRSKQLMQEIETLKENLRDNVEVVKKQKAENERLHKTIEELKHAESGVEPTTPDPERKPWYEGEDLEEYLDSGDEDPKGVSAEKIDRIRYQIKFQQEYVKLRDVCRQWSDEVRDLRNRLATTEKNLEAFRIKYKSIRKSALGYKKLAAEREKRLAEEKEAHKQHLDDIQFKMAKTIHKREAEINAKIAEIEKSNNEKLKVIMMLQRTAECSGAVANMNNNSGKNNVKYNVKYSDNLNGKQVNLKANKKNEDEISEAKKLTNGEDKPSEDKQSKKSSKVMNTKNNVGTNAIKPIDNRIKPSYDGDVKSVDNLVVKPSGISIVKPRDKRVKPDDSSVVKSDDSSVVKPDENLIVKPSYNRAKPDENLVDKPCDSRDPKSSKTRVVKPNDNRVKPKSNRDLKPDVNPVIPNEALCVKPRDNLVKFDDSRIVKPSVNRDVKSDHSRVVKPSDKEIVESDDSRIVKPVNPVVKHSDNEVVKLSDERNVKSIENLVVKPRGSRDKTEDNGDVKPNNDLAGKPEDQVLNLETNNSDKDDKESLNERSIKDRILNGENIEEVWLTNRSDIDILNTKSSHRGKLTTNAEIDSCTSVDIISTRSSDGKISKMGNIEDNNLTTPTQLTESQDDVSLTTPSQVGENQNVKSLSQPHEWESGSCPSTIDYIDISGHKTEDKGDLVGNGYEGVTDPYEIISGHGPIGCSDDINSGYEPLDNASHMENVHASVDSSTRLEDVFNSHGMAEHSERNNLMIKYSDCINIRGHEAIDYNSNINSRHEGLTGLGAMYTDVIMNTGHGFKDHMGEMSSENNATDRTCLMDMPTQPIDNLNEISNGHNPVDSVGLIEHPIYLTQFTEYDQLDTYTIGNFPEPLADEGGTTYMIENLAPLTNGMGTFTIENLETPLLTNGIGYAIGNFETPLADEIGTAYMIEHLRATSLNEMGTAAYTIGNFTPLTEEMGTTSFAIGNFTAPPVDELETTTYTIQRAEEVSPSMMVINRKEENGREYKDSRSHQHKEHSCEEIRVYQHDKQLRDSKKERENGERYQHCKECEDVKESQREEHQSKTESQLKELTVDCSSIENTDITTTIAEYNITEVVELPTNSTDITNTISEHLTEVVPENVEVYTELPDKPQRVLDSKKTSIEPSSMVSTSSKVDAKKPLTKKQRKELHKSNQVKLQGVKRRLINLDENKTEAVVATSGGESDGGAMFDQFGRAKIMQELNRTLGRNAAIEEGINKLLDNARGGKITEKHCENCETRRNTGEKPCEICETPSNDEKVKFKTVLVKTGESVCPRPNSRSRHPSNVVKYNVFEKEFKITDSDKKVIEEYILNRNKRGPVYMDEMKKENLMTREKLMKVDGAASGKKKQIKSIYVTVKPPGSCCASCHDKENDGKLSQNGRLSHNAGHSQDTKHSHDAKHSQDSRHSPDERHSNYGRHSQDRKQSHNARLSQNANHSQDFRHSQDERHSNDGRHSHDERHLQDGKRSENAKHSQDGRQHDTRHSQDKKHSLDTQVKKALPVLPSATGPPKPHKRHRRRPRSRRHETRGRTLSIPKIEDTPNAEQTVPNADTKQTVLNSTKQTITNAELKTLRNKEAETTNPSAEAGPTNEVAVVSNEAEDNELVVQSVHTKESQEMVENPTNYLKPLGGTQTRPVEQTRESTNDEESNENGSRERNDMLAEARNSEENSDNEEIARKTNDCIEVNSKDSLNNESSKKTYKSVEVNNNKESTNCETTIKTYNNEPIVKNEIGQNDVGDKEKYDVDTSQVDEESLEEIRNERDLDNDDKVENPSDFESSNDRESHVEQNESDVENDESQDTVQEDDESNDSVEENDDNVKGNDEIGENETINRNADTDDSSEKGSEEGMSEKSDNEIDSEEEDEKEEEGDDKDEGEESEEKEKEDDEDEGEEEEEEEGEEEKDNEGEEEEEEEGEEEKDNEGEEEEEEEEGEEEKDNEGEEEEEEEGEEEKDNEGEEEEEEEEGEEEKDNEGEEEEEEDEDDKEEKEHNENTDDDHFETRTQL
ncbi:hypothetical protein M8J75_002725 [Diaphorina citri]|nr:hypothetical protein M8J75_002725 [Diaphorina citri]